MKLTIPRSAFLILLLSTVGAPLAAALIVIVALNPPADDLRLLVLFMSGTGLVTIFAAYLLYRLGLIRRLPSLHLLMLVIVALTVVLVFVNVWVTARLMFISEHDFALTMALLVFAGLTAIVFGFFVATAFTERIRDLAGASKELAKGKLDTRLTVQGSDEIARLSEMFNRMADSLEKIDQEKRAVEQTRRDLIAWVSHDLRTPLASMRAMIEALADDVVSDPETRTRYLDSVLTEIGHLNHLIDDLFELAKLDARQEDFACEPASLSDLISDTLGSMAARAESCGVILEGAVDSEIDPVCMAADKIQRVLDNLIDNALRHTPPGGQVTVRASRHGDGVQVDVRDTGQGIDLAHLPRIFDSFYRVEGSRSRAEDGHRGAGLGLAIARRLVEAHGGKIWAESAPALGTTFSFTLPRNL